MKILQWVGEMFGSDALTPRQRALRVLEEAVEFAQSEDIESEMVIKILNRVYAKPKGVPDQELAQLGLCLEAAAQLKFIDLQFAIAREFDKVQRKPKEYWVARHSKKIEEGLE